MRVEIEEIGERRGIVKRTFFVEMDPGDTAWQLKQRIEEQEGIPARLQTLYGGTKVGDNWIPWIDCGLRVQRKLQIRQRSPKNKGAKQTPSPSQVSVNVVGAGGRYISLDNVDDVRVLKKKAADKVNLPLESFQIASFDGKLLQDECPLPDYNIVNGSTLYLRSDHPVDMGGWNKQEEVEIHLKGDVEMDVRVGVLHTVLYIKNLIKKQANIPEEDTLRLFFSNKNLDDGHNMEYYSIKDGSLVYARRQRAKILKKPKENKRIRMTVVIENEEEFTLEMNIFDKISEIFYKIFAKTGIPVEHQFFFGYGARFYTLSDYEIDDGYVLNVQYLNGRVRVPVCLAQEPTRVFDGIPSLPEWVTKGDRLRTKRPGVLKWSEVEGYQYFPDIKELPKEVPLLLAMDIRGRRPMGNVNWMYVDEFYRRNYVYWYSSGAFKCIFESQQELENDDIYTSVLDKILVFHACHWFEQQVHGEQQHGKDFDINKHVEKFAQHESKELYWTSNQTPLED